jgi:arginyl-tRNA synthetase
MGYPADIEFDVSEPPRREFGDLTCNVSFQLAKHAKKAPARIAIELADAMLARLDNSGGSGGGRYIQSVEAHPAGYVNFKANHALLSKQTLNKVLGEPSKYGYPATGEATHVLVEHTSVNPNKALHVGHVRNVIIGDAIFRLLQATGHRMTVLNYVDDSGLQVADIVIGFKFAGFPLEPRPAKSLTSTAATMFM